MKKLIITILFLAWAGTAHAQVVGEIKDVKIDELRGSIIVEKQYKINGVVVDVDGTTCVEKDGKYYINVLVRCENGIPKLSEQMFNLDNSACNIQVNGNPFASVWKHCAGQSRYTEETGDIDQITEKALEDRDIHVENLVTRIPANTTFIQTKMLERQKELTEPLIAELKQRLIGQKVTKTEATTEFKGKIIKVTYDQKNSISDNVLTP